MERYIGLDAHASSCTLGVVGPSGKRLGSHVVETNARALIDVLRGIPRSRHLCLEEGDVAVEVTEHAVANGVPRGTGLSPLERPYPVPSVAATAKGTSYRRWHRAA